MIEAGSRRGVLVMAYGTPASMDELADYYTDIRRGRPPPPELLRELRGRYEAIGGRSPLLDITREQTRGLQERLGNARCYLGMKHSEPRIQRAVNEMKADGITDATGLVLAPHYSEMSVGDYAGRVEQAAQAVAWDGRFHIVPSWHLEPGFIALLAERVRDAISTLEEGPNRCLVVFTAHSLPATIVERGDPYPQQLRETAEAVAAAASIARWTVAWQSAGHTKDAWLGPDIVEVLGRRTHDASAIVVCPCGFVSDHLEVLYDIDVEAQAAARRLGVRLVRTRSPNADPTFLDALASVVHRAWA